MSDETKNCDCGEDCCKPGRKSRYDKTIRVGDGGFGWLFFCAFIGAAVYFVSKANGFWDGALGILKAIVWPAFLVYQAFTGMHL